MSSIRRALPKFVVAGVVVVAFGVGLVAFFASRAPDSIPRRAATDSATPSDADTDGDAAAPPSKYDADLTIELATALHRERDLANLPKLVRLWNERPRSEREETRLREGEDLDRWIGFEDWRDVIRGHGFWARDLTAKLEGHRAEAFTILEEELELALLREEIETFVLALNALLECAEPPKPQKDRLRNLLVRLTGKRLFDPVLSEASAEAKRAHAYAIIAHELSKLAPVQSRAWIEFLAALPDAAWELGSADKLIEVHLDEHFALKRLKTAEIEPLLSHRSAAARRTGVRVFLRLASDPRERISRAIRLLEDTDQRVAGAVADSATSLRSGTETIERDWQALVKLLEHPSPEVRARATGVLGVFDVPAERALPELTERLLEDESPIVHRSVFSVLSWYESEAAKFSAPLLERLEKSLDRSELSFELVHALLLTKAPPEEVLAVVVPRISKPTDLSRKAMLYLLMRLGSPAKQHIEALGNLSETHVRETGNIDWDVVATILDLLGLPGLRGVPGGALRKGSLRDRLLAISRGGSKLALLAPTLERYIESILAKEGSPKVFVPGVVAYIDALRSISPENEKLRDFAFRLIDKRAETFKYSRELLQTSTADEDVDTHHDLTGKEQLASYLRDLAEIGRYAKDGQGAQNLVRVVLSNPDVDPRFRREAASAAALGDRFHGATLSEFSRFGLGDDPRLRRHVAEAAKKVVYGATARSIHEIATSRWSMAWLFDPDPTTRSVSTGCFAAFGVDDIDDYVGPLVRQIDEESVPVRRAVLDALGELGPACAKHTPSIVKLLDDEDPGVRTAAVRALGLIGSGAASALDAIRESTGEAGHEAVVRTAIRRIE